MYYSSIGILATLVLFIINYDVLMKSSKNDDMPARRSYRNFLLGVFGYYLTDIFWGAFYSLKIIAAAYIDTEVYFALMAATVFLWTRYVIAYLNRKNVFSALLRYVGWFFLAFQLCVLAVNVFRPIAFWFDADGTYHAGVARLVNMMLQFALFLLMSLYMAAVSARTGEKMQSRHRAIFLFGVGMTIFVLLQAFFPLMPFYSMGYMLSTCILHTFVIEAEKEARRDELEKLLQVERIQEAELGSARQMAYTDPLTGVKNKNAYLEDVTGIERRIEDNVLANFAIAVFDVNGLKAVNDTRGHDEGDKFIKSASSLICHEFKHSPVYRIGGDEFVAFLMGEDFRNRGPLLADFNKKIERNLSDGGIVISCGADEFRPGQDDCYLHIFERADMKMYERKRLLKGLARPDAREPFPNARVFR